MTNETKNNKGLKERAGDDGGCGGCGGELGQDIMSLKTILTLL